MNDIDYDDYMFDWRSRVDSGELCENVRSWVVVKYTDCMVWPDA